LKKILPGRIFNTNAFNPLTGDPLTLPLSPAGGREGVRGNCTGYKKYFCVCIGFLFFITLFSAGCGYHFQGGESNLPADIRSVAIPIFANATIQTGIESEVTRALIEKFTSAGRLALAGKDSADTLLTGTVKSFVVSSVAVTTGTQIATGYRATLTVEISFHRQRDSKVFLKEEVSEWRNYLVASDLAVTETNKREAIRQISALLAERIHGMILENF